MLNKIIIIMIIFQITFIPISDALSWGEMLSAGDDFIKNGSDQGGDAEIDDSQLTSTIKSIYKTLLILGIVVAVLVGAALGIKFMVGSIEEQVKVKETLLPYVTGCIVVFGAFGIWELLIVFLNKL